MTGELYEDLGSPTTKDWTFHFLPKQHPRLVYHPSALSLFFPQRPPSPKPQLSCPNPMCYKFRVTTTDASTITPILRRHSYHRCDHQPTIRDTACPNRQRERASSRREGDHKNQKCLTSQCCTAVSIDTGTALARYLASMPVNGFAYGVPYNYPWARAGGFMGTGTSMYPWDMVTRRSIITWVKANTRQCDD